MDKSRNTTPARPLEYNRLPWGDLIYGTKDQIRSLGVAVANAFPGDEGCTRRRLVVTDPRGFKCLIERCDYREEGVFCASIPLPGREPPEPPLVLFSPGVLKQENIWSDDFVGTAEALAAAGLASLKQLPGQPGMRKTIVTILADGSLPEGASNAKHPAARMAGAKEITRASKTTYRVSVFVTEEDRLRRYDADRQSRHGWEKKMRKMPRPAPLHARLMTSTRKEKAPITSKYRADGNVVYIPLE